LCDWLEDHLQDGSLSDLLLHPTVLHDLILQLTEFQFETEDVSSSIRAYELRSALEAIADELEVRPAGTSSFVFAHPLSIWLALTCCPLRVA